MAIVPILKARDPRPHMISAPIKMIDDGLRTPIADMFKKMCGAPGIGLAA